VCTLDQRRSGLIHDSLVVAPGARRGRDTLRLSCTNSDKTRGSRRIQGTAKGVTCQLKGIRRHSVTCEGFSIQSAKGSSFTVNWISWHHVKVAGPRAESRAKTWVSSSTQTDCAYSTSGQPDILTGYIVDRDILPFSWELQEPSYKIHSIIQVRLIKRTTVRD
jgi:hypothetical protein